MSRVNVYDRTMTNKHTATLPDGTIATRNSANRTYTHAIAVADRADKIVEEHEAALARYAAWPEDIRANRPDSARYFARIAAELEIAKAAKPHELILWAAVAWAGRPDLAEKAAAQHRGKWADVRIIPATVTH